ncbi:restriction endonuclease subunit S [Rhodococcoides kroppenstedtii]|uniref:restriction endonuclease subunit S n=1 Tax=Rhodococcoides kroppenstedtii TaxID=293050 RepID=UPI00362C35B7
MSSTVRLREVGSTYGGLTGKTKADFGRGDARFVTFLEVINSTRLSGRALEQVEVKKGERQNSVKRGDVLFNGSSETPEEVALSAVVDFDPNISTFLNSFCFGFRLRPDAAVDSTYLAYFFRSTAGRSLVSSLAQGATRYNIAKTKFLDVELALPSIERQREIVEWLKDADDLIATLERLIAKKQAIKQGMMQQLLTGRTRLPGFSAPRTRVVLGDVARFSKGSGLPKSALTTSGSTPCIHYGELFTSYGPEILHVLSRTNPNGRVVVSEDLDVLMPTSDVTPRGLAKASALHGRGVVLGGDVLIVRPDKTRAYGPFLAHAIRHDADQVLKLVRGSTVYHLYAADMRNFTLKVPSVEEQQAISGVLLDAEREIEGLCTRLSKAKDTKTGMMQQLLTGRTRLPVEAA